MIDRQRVRIGRKFAQVSEGAKEIFLRDGFSGTSVDDIAAAARVSKATLYSYFADKRLMFEEAMQNERQRLDSEAPREFTSPAGTTHRIDYTGDDAPSVEVRVQALFGLERHPMVGRTPLLLKLTSPAGRPIQSTRDLPNFWRGSWDDVRKDMKGRYPKHRWPEEPWAEKPSLKTKNAFSKSEG